MDVHAFVRLDDMRDPEGTSSHTSHLEVRFFVQVILLPEDGLRNSIFQAPPWSGRTRVLDFLVEAMRNKLGLEMSAELVYCNKRLQ